MNCFNYVFKCYGIKINMCSQLFFIGDENSRTKSEQASSHPLFSGLPNNKTSAVG